MRHPRAPFVGPFIIALAAVVAGGAEANVAHPAPVTDGDRLAGLHARQDVARGSAFAGDRATALGRLDGTELALLRRQFQDPGALLEAARTSAVSELDQARVDVLMADAQEARQAAAAAHHTIGVKFGAVSRAANRGGSLAQAGKETTP